MKIKNNITNHEQIKMENVPTKNQVVNNISKLFKLNQEETRALMKTKIIRPTTQKHNNETKIQEAN